MNEEEDSCLAKNWVWDPGMENTVLNNQDTCTLRQPAF